MSAVRDGCRPVKYLRGGSGQRSLDLFLRGNAFSVDAAKTHTGGARERVRAGEANFLPVECSPAAAARAGGGILA